MVMDKLKKNSTEPLTVSTVSWKGHLKRLTLQPNHSYLSVPLSACVSKGDQIRLVNGEAWVKCKNGESQFLQPYCERETLTIGGFQIEILVKEIMEVEEYQSYQSLAEFHYRNHLLHGRTARLIARTFHPMYPMVLGYVELATPFYMNKARSRVFDAPFKMNGISWDSWDMPTMRQYIHLIVRIARCVIYPEFRGLGLGQILVQHAADFARTRWQVAKLLPYFIEISADMLKYVPFAEKAGMRFIGNTEGNLARVAKDLEYLTRNAERVRAGEIVDQESCGIVDQQVSRMERALEFMEQNGLSREEFFQRLNRLSETRVLKDFAQLHNIISLPKPTYLMGLNTAAEEFLDRRLDEVSPSNKQQPLGLKIQPLTGSISFRNLTVTFASQVRRTEKTHAIQQAFGISPDSIDTTVLRNVSFEIQPGGIALIIGPSGSGKTTLLNILNKKLKGTVEISGEIDLPNNYRPGIFEEIRSRKPLIEVLGENDVASALHLMGLVGLSDAFIYLKRFNELSKGQQFRAMLARLIARGSNIWIIDEFCANLDPVTANVVAEKLQYTARKLKATVIVAAPHCENFLISLCPDKIIQLTSAWEHRLISGKELSENMSQGKLRGGPPSLRLLPEFIYAIRRGEKKSTIRKGHLGIPLGLLLLESDTQRQAVKVTHISHTRLCELTEQDANRDGFESLDELRRSLLFIYPNLKEKSALTVICFEPMM
jgi:ABC-type multidrug transport system ATPase subunit/GNAT superfamily N-acetyltransferase